MTRQGPGQNCSLNFAAQPSKSRSDRSRAGRLSAHPRGIIAVMAALLIPIFVTLLIGVLEYGFIILQRQQSEQTTDAAALAYGALLAKTPMSRWSSVSIDTENLRRFNSTFDVGSLTPPYIDPDNAMLQLTGEYPNAWAPAFVGVQQQMPLRSTGAGLLDFAQRWSIAPTTSLLIRSTARVKQVSLADFRFVPERVVLLLDFSRTMDLSYANDPTKGKASDVLKAAADQVINNYGDLVNLGLVAFSDGPSNLTTVAMVPETSDLNQKIDYSQYSTKQETIVGQLSGLNTSGDGTDLPGAINEGLALLRSAAADSSPSQASESRMILITDGEPDLGTGSREDRITQGRQQTAAAIAQAWNTDQYNGGSVGGVVSDVFFVQREGQDDTSDGVASTPTSAFLGSLAGTKQMNNNPSADQNYFLKDSGDPTAIAAFIGNRLTLQPRCFFPALTGADTKNWKDPMAARRYMLPATTTQSPLNAGAQRGETLYAYFTPDVFQRPDLEFPMQVWVNNLSEYNQQQLDAGYQGQQSASTPPEDYFVKPENQNQLLLHYDSSSNIVTVGGALCAVMYKASTLNDNLHMRIRLRWGQPRLVARTADRNNYCSSNFMADCGW